MASVNKWTKENSARDSSESGGGPKWPNEVMVKVFSSSHYSALFKQVDEKSKVLDVGCAFCNNLRFFHHKGCELYGIEVNDEMVDLAKKISSEFGPYCRCRSRK